MKKKFDQQFFSDLKKNCWSFGHYETALIKLALSRYKWNGLPLTVDETFLEKMLLMRGGVAFFIEEDVGLLSLPFNFAGEFDIYWNPANFFVYGARGFHRLLDNQNAVICYNNQLKLGDFEIIEFYARKLYLLDMIMDINSQAHKTPLLINCEQDVKQTLIQVFNDYDGNKPAIFANKKRLNPNDLSVIKLDAPFNLDKLKEYQKTIWNEALEMLGITNTVNQKKERMTLNESAMSVGGSLYFRNSGLIERRKACAKLKEMYGVDITVEYRDDEMMKTITSGVNSQLNVGGD